MATTRPELGSESCHVQAVLVEVLGVNQSPQGCYRSLMGALQGRKTLGLGRKAVRGRWLKGSLDGRHWMVDRMVVWTVETVESVNTDVLP